MKTIAFAGQYPVLKQIIEKYTGNKCVLDIIQHEMANGEKVKILVSKDPHGAEPNRYQWTRDADHILVCVDANELDFTAHLNEEIKVGRFDQERVILVGYANVLDEHVLEKFRDFATDNKLPMIYCAISTHDAYYAMEYDISHQDLKVIIDNIFNNTIELEPIAEETSDELEAVAEKKRHKCSLM